MTDLPKFPTHITIDISTSCNLRCVMCSLDEHYKGQGFMDWNVFEKILTIVPKLDYIDLNCNAEPLLNKRVFEMIAEIKKANPKIQVGFPSNGTIMSEKIAKQLIDAGVDIIRFSLDGATKKTFETIRKHADFDKVVKNIELLNKIKREKNVTHPLIIVTFVAMKDNIYELPDLVRLAKKLDAFDVSVLGLEPYFEENKDKPLYMDPEYFEEIYQKSLNVAHEENIVLKLPDLVAKENDCMFKDTFYITAKGDMTQCPMLCYDRPFYYYGKKMQHKKKSFGNVLDGDIEKIYNSWRFKRFRKKLYSKKFNLSCKGCLMKEGVIVPFPTKSL